MSVEYQKITKMCVNIHFAGRLARMAHTTRYNIFLKRIETNYKK